MLQRLHTVGEHIAPSQYRNDTGLEPGLRHIDSKYARMRMRRTYKNRVRLTRQTHIIAEYALAG